MCGTDYFFAGALVPETATCIARNEEYDTIEFYTVQLFIVTKIHEAG